MKEMRNNSDTVNSCSYKCHGALLENGLSYPHWQHPLAPTLTAQVVPQSCGIEARVAGIVVVGLVARCLVGDDKVKRFDRHGTDEDGQQGYGDHQQDDEGGAGVDVCAHQTHKQTQQKDYWGVQHCVPVTLRKHTHPPRQRWLYNRRKQAEIWESSKKSGICIKWSSLVS